MGVALVGGKLVPMRRLHAVLSHADTLAIQPAKVVLRRDIASRRLGALLV